MKTRKGRLIWLCIYFLMFLTLTLLYFSNQFFSSEQDAEMIPLIVYVFLSLIIALLAEWFGAFNKESPRYIKYIFQGIAALWFLFLWIFFKDMLFLMFFS
ncbi:hypothetical protein [Cytobacillus oceanisediminis]|uniref:Uncharacterized protein n=1 Tax=Cytobacillus oceanisediminis 2691 TaxID=1196031 RepID=A0A160MH60_9BACI|nr:hypothetical protein [Cytobacillus oceanisediminis]AND42384.1 hypothetical protein A361_25600 [Cytobacillus oceanisediminis 2691]MCM3246786.1 hypothetical protein [Cytobacillus oceanisediminis]MCS0827237.1 hypothetical protein [Cytobacillus firmus]